MAVHGLEESAPDGFCEAVLGTTFLSICVPQAAAGTPLLAGTTAAVSVLLELLEPWLIYVFACVRFLFHETT